MTCIDCKDTGAVWAPGNDAAPGCDVECPSCQVGAYDHVDEDDFDGLICACGQRMHASDTECRDCWRAREYPDS